LPFLRPWSQGFARGLRFVSNCLPRLLNQDGPSAALMLLLLLMVLLLLLLSIRCIFRR